MKYCYSTDQENFHGEFDSREDAVNEALNNDMTLDRVYTGEIVNAKDILTKIGGSSLVESVIEQMDEHLYEHVGGDDESVSLNKEASEELGQIIVDFVKEHGDFHRWGVANVKSE